MIRKFYKVPNLEKNIRYLLKIYYNIKKLSNLIKISNSLENSKKGIIFESKNYFFCDGYYYFSCLGLINYQKISPKNIAIPFEKIELHVINGFKNFCIKKKNFPEYEEKFFLKTFFDYDSSVFNFDNYGIKANEDVSQYNEYLLYKHNILVKNNDNINISRGFVCVESNGKIYFTKNNIFCNSFKNTIFKLNATFKCENIKYDGCVKNFYVKKKYIKFFDCVSEKVSIDTDISNSGFERIIEYNDFKKICGKEKTIYLPLTNKEIPNVKNLNEIKNFLTSIPRIFYFNRPNYDVVFKLTFKNFNVIPTNGNSQEFMDLINVLYPFSNAIIDEHSFGVIFNYSNLANIELC